MRRIATMLAAVLALMTLGGPALAHVTVQPSNGTQGTFSRFDVRVPNERPDDETIKIAVQFPPNLVFVNFQPKPGWTRTVTMKTLDTPIVVFGTEYTEVIDTVTWEGGVIKPHEFEEFGFTARTPDDATELIFPSIQTYANEGDVAWIGPEDDSTPAPVVHLAALPADEPTATEDATAEPTESAPTTSGSPESEADDDTDPLSIFALIAGLAGLGLGAVAFKRTGKD